MKRIALIAMLLAGAAAPGAAARAQGPAVAPLFEAAGRGDLAPAERALAESETSADLAVLLRAQLRAARLDPAAAAAEPALRRLAAAGGDPALRRAALAILTGTAFASGDYGAAAASGRALAEALAAAGEAEEAAGAERTWRLAALLAGRPGQRVAGAVAPGSIAARRDRVGLTRIDVSVNGGAQEAVVDTGANFSVLSAGAARRLGVRAIEGELAVGNGVEGTVPVRVGIADRLEIAGTLLTNVPFLIIDDSNLTFPIPGGYSIEAIVGLPVLRALGRVRTEQAGRFAVLAPAGGADGGGAPNLSASGNDLFAEMVVDGRPVPLHLDTGANRTSLSARYAEANPARVAALEAADVGNASAGGARRLRVATWPGAPVALAGRSFTLPALAIALPGEGRPPRFMGTLGQDVLRRFESYTIDFRTMRLELGEPVAD